jgi:RNA polymerase sigma factor (sigma-70 family)
MTERPADLSFSFRYVITRSMSTSSFESLEALVARLPFHLDDTGSINTCYARWFDSPSKRDRLTIDLWTYCFIRRYFLIKFVQESTVGPADFEELVDRTFRKVEQSAGQIKRPERYASWVSVVCKNTFLNYLRDFRRAVSLDADRSPQLVAETPQPFSDVGIVRQAVQEAIGRLPDYLQECVRLRFIEGLSYAEINDRTGYPLPRIRSYINKAMKRFREDSLLIAYLNVDE